MKLPSKARLIIKLLGRMHLALSLTFVYQMVN